MTKSSILVVEDEAVVALDIKMQLEDMGYHVVGIADNADQALALAHQHHPDLALMDIQLRGAGDGIEAAARLRLELRVPVIYLSSFSDSQTVRRAAETAPFGYLTKPFQIKELAAGVEVALYKSRLERHESHTERWLASTLRCVGDGVVMTFKDDTVRFMNPAAEALTGWPLEHARGRPLNEVVCIPMPSTWATAEHVPLPTAPVGFGQRMVISHSLVLRRRDASEVFVDEWTGPINDDDGSRLGTVVVLRSAEQRKQQEAQLQACDERFRTLFDFAPMGMALVSFDGHLLLANQAFAAMLGQEVNSLQGLSNRDISVASDLDHEAQRLRELQTGTVHSVQFEKRYQHANGHDLVGVLVIASLLREGDEATCWLYQVHDLTPQKRAAEQVAELTIERIKRKASEAEHRMTKDFLARVSHEMRTPLNAVLGYGQLLQMEAGETASQQRQYADQIVTAGQHLLAMVNDVLAAQRNGGGVSLVLQRLSLKHAVSEVVQLMLPMARAQQITMDAEIPAELFIQADATRLRQVLLNLASNAIKYNRSGGTVRWCSVPAAVGQVGLLVSDDGIGMTDEQLGHVFEPYERLGMESSDIPGTGLGLAITRHLVEQMGGHIEITSTARQGTQVLLSFNAAA